MSTEMKSSVLEHMKLVPNRVLVKITDTKDTVKLGDMTIGIDKQFSEEKHAMTTGIVVNHCGPLVPDKMDWETENVLMINDFVVFSYESAIYCLDPLKGRHFFDENANQYLLIDYGDIFTARRNEEIIPVNGYLLVEPVTEEIISEFKLPITTSMRYGKIAHVSPKNKRYFAAGRERNDVYDFDEELKVGDFILFSKFSDLPLEYDIHRSLQGSKPFFRMQRRDIYDIIKLDNFQKTKISLVY